MYAWQLSDLFTLAVTHCSLLSLGYEWQAGEAGKSGGGPAKKAEPAAKKPAEADSRPAASAPSKSKHGKKPQKDQQSANHVQQLFSHLQQYRVSAALCLLTFLHLPPGPKQLVLRHSSCELRGFHHLAGDQSRFRPDGERVCRQGASDHSPPGAWVCKQHHTGRQCARCGLADCSEPDVSGMALAILHCHRGGVAGTE